MTEILISGHINRLNNASAVSSTADYIPIVQNGVLNKATAGQLLSQTSTSYTFLPTIFGATTAGTNTYTVQDGSYQIVGRYCILSYDVAISGSNTGTGEMRMSLPFTPVTDNDISCTFVQNITFVANATAVLASAEFNQLYVRLRYQMNTGAATFVSNAELGSGFRIRGTLVYQIA